MSESEGIKTLRIERRRRLLEARAEEVAKLETDVRERLILLIHIHFDPTGRYEYLEKRYGISARKWKNVCNRVQLPGIDMLSSILKDHPQYSTWLMLGKAVNRREPVSVSEGKLVTTPESQADPFADLNIPPAVAQTIDPTIKGWESKLDKAVEQAFKNNAALRKLPSTD